MRYNVPEEKKWMRETPDNLASPTMWQTIRDFHSATGPKFEVHCEMQGLTNRENGQLLLKMVAFWKFSAKIFNIYQYKYMLHTRTRNVDDIFMYRVKLCNDIVHFCTFAIPEFLQSDAVPHLSVRCSAERQGGAL